MGIKTIPLSRPETDLKKTLNECAESGQTVVVAMPDHRLLAIQSLDFGADDNAAGIKIIISLRGGVLVAWLNIISE